MFVRVKNNSKPHKTDVQIYYMLYTEGIFSKYDVSVILLHIEIDTYHHNLSIVSSHNGYLQCECAIKSLIGQVLKKFLLQTTFKKYKQHVSVVFCYYYQSQMSI